MFQRFNMLSTINANAIIPRRSRSHSFTCLVAAILVLSSVPAFADSPASKNQFATVDGLKRVAKEHKFADVRAAAEQVLQDFNNSKLPETMQKMAESKQWADEDTAVKNALGLVTSRSFEMVWRILDREVRRDNPAAVVCPDLVKLMSLYERIGLPAKGPLEEFLKEAKKQDDAELAALERLGVAGDRQYQTQKHKSNVAQYQRHFAELALKLFQDDQK